MVPANATKAKPSVKAKQAVKSTPISRTNTAGFAKQSNQDRLRQFLRRFITQMLLDNKPSSYIVKMLYTMSSCASPTSGDMEMAAYSCIIPVKRLLTGKHKLVSGDGGYTVVPIVKDSDIPDGNRRFLGLMRCLSDMGETADTLINVMVALNGDLGGDLKEFSDGIDYLLSPELFEMKRLAHE